MNVKALARWATATLIGVAAGTSLSVSAETARLRVSIEGGLSTANLNFGMPVRVAPATTISRVRSTFWAA